MKSLHALNLLGNQSDVRKQSDLNKKNPI